MPNLSRDVLVIKKFPSNIEKIEAVFPGCKERNHVYAWGNVIYNPLGGHIDEPLRIHEMTHFAQQAEYDSVEYWWDLYLTNPHLRLEWEVEAYANQYRSYCAIVKDRNMRFKFLHHLAHDLSSPMYGDIVTSHRAYELIQNHVLGSKSGSKYFKGR